MLNTTCSRLLTYVWDMIPKDDTQHEGVHRLGAAVSNPTYERCEPTPVRTSDQHPPLTMSDDQSNVAAIPASSLRSDFLSVMCPANSCPRIRSTTYVNPFELASKYGLSIWYGSPVSTTLVS